MTKITKEIEEKEKENVSVKDDPKFTKDKLLKAHVLTDKKDIVNVVVANEEFLTMAEVNERIDAFLKREVK